MDKFKNLNGQLNFWDVEIKEFINKNKIHENDKTLNPLDLTLEQQKFLDINNIMQNDNLSRIIKYCGGGLGIELLEGEGFKTKYINKNGIEEFTFNKKSSILPTDQVIYFKINPKINSLQEARLKEIKKVYKDVQEIKRKGDENILIKVPGKVISINSKGWALEFNNVQAVYEDSEVIKDNVVEDLHNMQQRVKVGDFVQAMYGKKVINGNITREYGLGNEILNIEFGNKHTAIGRIHVLKILEAS